MSSNSFSSQILDFRLARPSIKNNKPRGDKKRQREGGRDIERGRKIKKLTWDGKGRTDTETDGRADGRIDGRTGRDEGTDGRDGHKEKDR